MIYKGNLNTTFKGCISITDKVTLAVKESGVKEGFVVISFPHTTAGLAITSFWDERGLEDLMYEIDRNIPPRVTYNHQSSPFDAAGHVKNSIMGGSVTLIIHMGKLILGSSQGIIFVEFDGPREREYFLQIIEVEEIYYQVNKLKTKFQGMHDITSEVSNVVLNSGITEGICHVSVLHSTAGLAIGPKDTLMQKDIMEDIERMVPTRGDFRHRETASDAGGHVKTALVGSQISLIVENACLALDEKQALIFEEFDGPRPRNYIVSVYKG